MLIELVKGRRVRNPANRQALELGAVVNVDKSQYWLRRIKAGDVIKSKAKQSSPAPKKEPKKETKKNEVK